MAMQVPTEEEILAGAIAGTEDEVGKSAFLSDEDFEKDINGELPDDDNGTDRSLEEMDDDIPGETEEGDEPDEEEPDGETDETEEEIDAASEEDGEEPRTPDGNIGRIPSSRLREETERRRAIEGELATARAQLAAFQVQQQPRQQPQQEQPAQPDRWSDPEAHDQYLLNIAEQRIVARQVNASLREAHQEHGEKFEAAYNSLISGAQQDPAIRGEIQSIWDSPNPGRSLMQWHNRQQVLREIGNDPDAWLERKLEERMNSPGNRRQVLSNMRADAERGDGDGRPRTSTRLPKSLNGASGGGSVRTGDPELYNDSDASAFAYAMK